MGTNGPVELAARVIQSRNEWEWDDPRFGDVTEAGVQSLIQLAFQSSLAPNEGRYPSFTFFVPAKGVKVGLDLTFRERVDGRFLRRVGPALGSRGHALVVREEGGNFFTDGVVGTRPVLAEMMWMDPDRYGKGGMPQGLYIEVSSPGNIRVWEWDTYRLEAGDIRQEISFTLDGWFASWYDGVAERLLAFPPDATPTEHHWLLKPGLAFRLIWLMLLRRTADLKHGGCLVIAPCPDDLKVKTGFPTTECRLGHTLADYCRSVRRDYSRPEQPSTEQERTARLLLRDRLISMVEGAAHLTQTDGCLIFDQDLELRSFGSMIEAGDSVAATPCVLGGGDTPLSEEVLRSYGARRRSAIQLCQACDGVMAFVISQDGDLRIVIRDGGVVRLFDHAAYW